MFEIYLSSYSKRIYKKRAKITSIVGIFVIIAISSLLHFGFDFFGRIKASAVILQSTIVYGSILRLDFRRVDFLHN